MLIPADAPPAAPARPAEPRSPAPPPAAAPLTLGPFVVGEDGVLAPRAPHRHPPRLRFAWRGRRCEASLEGPGELRLAATAGRIPSTAEAGAGGRGAAFAALGALGPTLPPGWRVALTPDHRVRFEARARLAVPATATGLIAALVGFALALDPYLDRLDSAGAGWPAAETAASGAGRAKIWPG
ncbi:hypothetical protein [Caldovatus aquaticus]|uniref:Uncharacterized protein n=1 Tax=Caldovatus aquaticus TaxID=2865671 RepID=A0ABS7F040_9PROT|nr:hypothetical protein [Caldovatus aquaticus]MBW8268959.1 hypothetical protein [Caldovatus aquaticus]